MVPMVVGQDVVGALEVSEAQTPRRFTTSSRPCTALGEQAATYSATRAHRQLRDQNHQLEEAEEDHRTSGHDRRAPPGCTHRHFFDRLRRQVTRAQRYGLVLSRPRVASTTSNAQRPLRPSGGRPDAACQQRALWPAASQPGIPARYGGEEFAVILLYGTQETAADLADGARASAERIRRAIADMEMQLAEDGTPTHITTSVGLAMLRRRRCGRARQQGRSGSLRGQARRQGPRGSLRLGMTT